MGHEPAEKSRKHRIFEYALIDQPIAENGENNQIVNVFQKTNLYDRERFIKIYFHIPALRDCCRIESNQSYFPRLSTGRVIPSVLDSFVLPGKCIENGIFPSLKKAWLKSFQFATLVKENTKVIYPLHFAQMVLRYKFCSLRLCFTWFSCVCGFNAASGHVNFYV